jgi:heme-degrading monooxygenase HmoA
MKRYFVFATALIALATGIGIGLAVTPAHSEDTGMVYELRKYYVFPGKEADIHKRFREHTMAIFEKHGMKNIAYWTPTEKKEGDPELVYIVAHASREQAKDNWKGFSTDPEWQKVQKESEANGKIVQKVESQFLTPTDYSPLK